MSTTEFVSRLTNNLILQLDYKFHYLIAINITMLIIRLSIILQFNQKIGPLLKIIGKMLIDFVNFFILYVIMTLMFSIVGNLNFVEELKEFSTYFQSVLTIIDTSLGNYDLEIYDQVHDHTLKSIGEFLTIFIVTVFNIIMMNFIISILANTYNIFDNKSNGLFLSKILSSRDEMFYDESYGAFLTHFPPINLIQVPAIPFALVLRQKHPLLHKINRIVNRTQYIMLMLLVYVYYIVICGLIAPVAYLLSCGKKLKNLYSQNSKENGYREKMIDNVGFFVGGIVILALNMVSDSYYFWINNFRTDLKMIIVEKDQTKITHASLRQFMATNQRYGENKIKSLSTNYLIKIFRQRFTVKQNLQFLIFGQHIRKKGTDINIAKHMTFKSMKTKELREDREAEILKMDDTVYRQSAKHKLE